MAEFGGAPRIGTQTGIFPQDQRFRCVENVAGSAGQGASTGDRVAAGARVAWFAFAGEPMRGQQEMSRTVNGSAATRRGSSDPIVAPSAIELALHGCFCDYIIFGNGGRSMTVRRRDTFLFKPT